MMNVRCGSQGKLARVMKESNVMPQDASQRLRVGAGTLRGEGAQAMVEFAFAFPLQLLIMFAIMQLALIYVARQVVTYASYSAARAAMVTVDPRDAARRAARAAALVCSPITGGTVAGSAFTAGELTSPPNMIHIPGWGYLPKSGVSLQLKTYLSRLSFTETTVTATVTHYYELLFPAVNYAFAWLAGAPAGGLRPGAKDFDTAFGETGTDATADERRHERTVGIWNIRGSLHIRLRATTTLAIPGTEAGARRF